MPSVHLPREIRLTVHTSPGALPKSSQVAPVVVSVGVAGANFVVEAVIATAGLGMMMVNPTVQDLVRRREEDMEEAWACNHSTLPRDLLRFLNLSHRGALRFHLLGRCAPPQT